MEPIWFQTQYLSNESMVLPLFWLKPTDVIPLNAETVITTFIDEMPESQGHINCASHTAGI